MEMIDMWAKKWGIAIDAMTDLKISLGIVSIETPQSSAALSEAAVQNIVRLEASKKGARLWRNNLGAVYTREGTFIRYGLCNDSSAVNKKIKSADLIGIRPIKITQDHVGTTVGQFVSREIKSTNWKFSGTERETAQLEWAKLIMSLGGSACFATCEGTL